MTRPHPPGQTPARTLTDTITETVVATGVAVLVLMEFAASYDTLRTLAITDGGFPAWPAPAVPLSFDLGIVVLSLKVVTAACEGRHAITLRSERGVVRGYRRLNCAPTAVTGRTPARRSKAAPGSAPWPLPRGRRPAAPTTRGTGR